MLVLVVCAAWVITALCVTFGWMLAGMPNFFEPVRHHFQPHDPDYYRHLWKSAGYALHLPSYREGKERYVPAKDANTVISPSLLHGLYDINLANHKDY